MLYNCHKTPLSFSQTADKGRFHEKLLSKAMPKYLTVLAYGTGVHLQQMHKVECKNKGELMFIVFRV